MLTKIQFKKKIRKQLIFLEEAEKYSALVHDDGIMYSKIVGAQLYKTSIFFHPNNRFEQVLIRKSIPEIEEIFQKVCYEETTEDKYSIHYSFSDFLMNSFPESRQEFGNYLIIETEEQLCSICQSIQAYYYSKDVQAFLSMGLKELNDQLLNCHDLNEYHVGIICSEQYLRTYIVASICQNQRVFDWFDNLIFPWLNEQKDDYYWRTQLQYIEKVKDMFTIKN